MGMYEFKEEDAINFLNSIGTKYFRRGNQIIARVCPYCKPNPNDRANINKFAIDATTGQFNCLRASCGVKGNMITLAKDFDFSLGVSTDEYYQPKKKYRTFKKPEKPIVPKPKAVEYLAKRGISEEVASKYQITTQTEHENILVFPFLNEHGDMEFIKYRDTEYTKEKGGNKEWCERNMKPILFGMFQCVPPEECDTLVITEGQADSLALATCGVINPISVPTGAKGFTWIPYCWDWVNRYKNIIVFGDYERGEITLYNEIKTRFGKLNVKHIRPQDYKDCKDANELLLKYGKEHILSCIENAEFDKAKGVISLSDVKDIDVFSIEKLKTGINKLDNLLYGGLPFGYLTILMGKRGDGKSCLASQIVANAIDQNIIPFAYSGELTSGNFKAWIDFQLAGRQNIIDQTTPNGAKQWFIRKSTREEITKWYSERIYIYDDNDIGDEEEDILNTIEEVICRNGCRLVLIDNLMTALDITMSKVNDKYEKQSQFVKALARMARKFNVIILLVVHRRKSKEIIDVNDEASGSADITNLAGVVMSYDRDKEDVSARRLIVSKNRLFGKLDYDGIKLQYEEKSKRIYGENDNVDKAFGWAIKTNGFSQADVSPFD